MFSRMASAISLLNSALTTLNTFKPCSQNPYSEHGMNILVATWKDFGIKASNKYKTKMQYLDNTQTKGYLHV